MFWNVKKSRRFDDANALKLRLEALEERQLLTAVGWNAPTNEQVPYGPEYCATFASRYEPIDLTNIKNDVAPILTTASNEWTVSSTAAAGAGTLRWAIDQAESSGGGTIKFTDGLNGGAIYLGATGELSISCSLTIDASNLSDGITISAASDASETYGNCRVFSIDGSGVDTMKVEMIGVTITGGRLVQFDSYGGGGICVTNANLTLTNSRVENNCVQNDSYAFGGGIYAKNSELTLTNSTIAGNFVSDGLGKASGGGIYGYYSTTINLISSTILANTAVIGGGICIQQAEVNLTNATVAGNSVTQMGGGIFVNSGGSATLKNSIITNNYASYMDPNIYGDWTGGTQYNIVGDEPAFVCAPQFDANGKPINVDAWNLRLTKNSKAIDAGNNDDVVGEYDCDGNARVLFGNKGTLKPTVDLGAYEREFVKPGSKMFTVDSLDGGDGSDVDGDRTLRWAIEQASSDEWDDYDVLITFANGLNGGAIYLGDYGELSISRHLNGHSLTIDASDLSDGITISAASDASETYGKHRVFSIKGNAIYTLDVEMIGVTITGGRCTDVNGGGGGGIVADRVNLTLTNSRVENNCVEFYHYPYGGGICVNDYGSLTLTSSTVSGNFVSGRHARGGGIYASGPVTLTNSRVENNYVENTIEDEEPGDFSLGGGIFIGPSVLTLTSSIISGNFVSGKYADGGGIYLFYTKLMLTSSTVFGNFVSGEHANGGGIYAHFSTVELTNATVAGNSAENGGGIYELSDSQTTLRNSIVTKNHASNGAADDADIYGNWTGGTQYNIVGDDPDFVYAPQFDDADGKPINVDAWNLRLKETSKAIDVGNNADVVGEYDCDGNARVLFGKKTTLKPTVDLGAYEFEFVDPSRKTFTVDSLGCGAGSDVDGERTLRWAIDQASLDVWKDYVVLITFADYLIGTGAIYLGATGELSISRSLTIDAEGVMIDANGNSRIFNVAPGTTVTIYGGTFTNGKSGSTETPENGGAIYNAGTLTLNGANFQANTATKNGGAIYNAGTLTLNDANFQANMATKNGGAIFNDEDAILKVDGGEYWANLAVNGGAIANYGTTKILGKTETLFDNNRASKFGGAYFGVGSLVVGSDGSEKTSFVRNTAGYAYVEIAVGVYSLIVEYEGGKGGAIYNDVWRRNDADLIGTVAITGAVEFSGNRATERGGAIQTYSELTITPDEGESVVFESNTALKYGGALDVGTGAEATLGGEGYLTFDSNKALGVDEQLVGFGGAIFSAGNLTFKGDGRYLFTKNEAAKSGGAIDASRGKLTLTGDFEFTLNKANGSFDEEADGSETPESKTGVGGGILTAAQTFVQTSDGSKASFTWGEGENVNTADYGSCVAIDTNISNLGYDLFGLENDTRYATFTVFRWNVSKTTALLPTTFAPQAKLAAITIGNVTTTFDMNGVTPEQLGLGVGTTNALVSYVDASGEASATYSLILTVENDASLYVVETAIANDRGVKFNFNLTKEDGGAVAVWEISWGDGTTSRFERLSNSLTAAHYYAQDGFFDVSLKATYLDGTCTTFESFATRKVGGDAKFKAVDDVFATSDDLFDELELGPFLR